MWKKSEFAIKIIAMAKENNFTIDDLKLIYSNNFGKILNPINPKI